jgi:pyruvate carboxylase subunit A
MQIQTIHVFILRIKIKLQCISFQNFIYLFLKIRWMFSKILVANRGEIAVRVMRAARELEIKNVAVYSEADKGAFFKMYADEAYFIGEGPASKSYLVTEQIIEAAEKAGAEAIHPGYGFLAENPTFAEECKKAGLVFVGPSSDAIEKINRQMMPRRLPRGLAILCLSRRLPVVAG